jgi:transcriptional regulator with XRE-family HTH domain
MQYFSYNKYHSMNDQALTVQIGSFIKHHRLAQNKTQDTLSHEAGISRSTLSLLERGETTSLATLIQVLRVLDQLQIMHNFEVVQEISPIALAKEERSKRKRARNIKPENDIKSNW